MDVPEACKCPPPNTGSGSTIRLPTTRFSALSQNKRIRAAELTKAQSSSVYEPATKDAGQGSSNTVPRQSLLKISDTVMHFFSEAHHAQSSIPAQPSHVVCVSQVGIAVVMREKAGTSGQGAKYYLGSPEFRRPSSDMGFHRTDPLRCLRRNAEWTDNNRSRLYPDSCCTSQLRPCAARIRCEK